MYRTVHLGHSLTFNDPILGWIIAARTSIIALDRFSSRYVAQYLHVIQYLCVVWPRYRSNVEFI